MKEIRDLHWVISLFLCNHITKKFRDVYCFLDISLFVFLTVKMLILIPRTKAIRIFIDFLPRVSFMEANSAYVNSFTERLPLSLLESWWELHILVVAKNRETKMMFVRYTHSRHQGNEDDIGTYLFFSSSFYPVLFIESYMPCVNPVFVFATSLP